MSDRKNTYIRRGATLDGYCVGWPMGASRILLVSLGTGLRNPAVTPSSITVSHAVKSLLALYG
jgi:hypothetical protein